MKIFGSKKEEETKRPIANEDKKTADIKTNERPRICCIDISDENIKLLERYGFNIYNGTLGAKVKVPNTYNKSHYVLLNYNFPANLHEYDIVIIDLDNYKTIDYNINDHTRDNHSGKKSHSILSSYPETLFDPRPLSSAILKKQLEKITNRTYLVLVFSSESYQIDYETIEISENYRDRQEIQQYNIYSFWDYLQLSTSKFGKEIIVNKVDPEFQLILEKHKIDSFYNQTFHHPTTYTGGKPTRNENYIPLMTNINGDIISFFEMNDGKNLMILPQLKEKGIFLNDFLTKICPSIFPELFPFSSTFEWKNKSEYWLPNHSTLLKQKSDIQNEYDIKLKKNDLDIEKNIEQYSFLHEILSESGDDLVKPLIKYFKWLGFDDIIDFDESKIESNILEEDIQIKLESGILIIECKGIGGTSTDSNCSQISKIKHRRCKERNKFDVYALYIVNHQRYLPPLNRQNPPFTPHQLEDAKNDERGLLTTWQLYNLYFDVENKIISKFEARNSILNFGLIKFRPQNLKHLYEPVEFFKENKICIVNIKGILLTKNQEVYVENNGRFEIAKLLDIQLNESSVESCSNGELGLRFDKKILKKSILWIKDV